MQMRYPILLACSVALIAAAFNFSEPLPDVKTDEAFLPKPEYVKLLAAGQDVAAAGIFWINGLVNLGDSYLTGHEYDYLGHVGELSTSLDSLFFTPYYFVGGVVSIGEQDTTDFSVMRRATRIFPGDWKLAMYFAIRLAHGPYKLYDEAANVMRPFASSTDTTIPLHAKNIYRSFELKTMQTEIALASLIEDCADPNFAMFRLSLRSRARHVLGFNMEKNDTLQLIDSLVFGVMDGKVDPTYAYRTLLTYKREDAGKDSSEVGEVKGELKEEMKTGNAEAEPEREAALPEGEG